jgi:hypothetical protein
LFSCHEVKELLGSADDRVSLTTQLESHLQTFHALLL